MNGFLGKEIDDRMGKLRLQIGPLKAAQFQSLLPGGGGFDKMAFLTKFYMTDPMDYDVELSLDEGEARPVCLGQAKWSRLGWDTWIFAGDHLEEATVRFFPEANVG
jgi:type VI secretion system protein ImpH